MDTPPEQRLTYIWSYELTEAQFLEILRGEQSQGWLNQEWAALRLLEQAPYEEIIRLLGFPSLVQYWPRWRDRVSSHSRRRGIDFLTAWLAHKHPELLKKGSV